MAFTVQYLEKAKKELKDLDASVKKQVLIAIDKVSANPLPQSEGGYGKPLGNKANINLTGCNKIKLRQIGMRVVYQLVKEDETMKIIVISVRSDNEVYKLAADRIQNEWDKLLYEKKE